MLQFMKRHKLLSGIFIVLLLLFCVIFGYVRFKMRGEHREYAIDFVLPESDGWKQIGDLEVGVAVRDITPSMDDKDTWVDVNGNGKFEKGVDEWNDRNGNGKLDFAWIAGFDMSRPAMGVNDPVWSRALAFRNNGVTIAIVSIDSIGITNERYITIRKMIHEANPDIDHVAFSATHSHEAPDTMGIWSYSLLWRSLFDEGYMRMLQEKTRDAVLEAVANLKPADTVIAAGYVPEENFIRDSREPKVMVHQLPLAWFKEKGTENTIAVLTSWGMHPEAMGSENLYISSDFVHYFREAMEKGLEGPDAFEGFGGKCVFFTGPVGGLMTQLSIEIKDRYGNAWKDSSIEKAQAQGENLAIIAAQALRSEEARTMTESQVAVSAKTFFLTMGWPFKAALYLGIVHPGIFNGQAKSEINALRIGEIEIVTTPGEIYPEIVFGGVENPEGADFKIEPVEVPPFFAAMKGALKMNFNLANDEIGYIVPKSQWDQKPPYTYGRDKAPYGEMYTGNPEVAPGIHKVTMDVLNRLHHTLESMPAAENL